MAAEPQEQPVLLTEGSFAQEEEKTTEEAEVATSSPALPPDQEGADAAAEPVSSPDDAGTQEVLGRALSAALSPIQGAGDGDELQETLSEKLAKVPSEAGDCEEDEYVPPPEDPYMRAVNYMEKHKVMQIFQKLTAEIVYHRPPDPLEHMLTELEKMKKERDDRIEDIISSASSLSQP